MAWTRGREVGKGSTATVSVATTTTGDIFAVKSTEFSKSQFLQREKEILSTLSSPHVVGCKGSEVTKERNELYYNLFMEYVSGGTLSDEICRRGGRMDEKTIGAYTCQILKGIEYLHSNGVVHCDIKGRNILISEQDGAKLADFGCSKRMESAANGAVSISGTPVYMSPEAARGEEQGFEADIWALGCTMIEMAIGGPAWFDCGSDPAQVLYRIAFSDQIPAIPNWLSDQGKDFLSKCLTRNPKLRWTATELLSHPFLNKIESFPKPSSISPTSILECQLWSSSESQLERTQMEMEVRTLGEGSEDRIGQLAEVSGRPGWESDEDWVQVRSESSSVSQVKDSDFYFQDSVFTKCGDVAEDGGDGFMLGDLDFGRWRCHPSDSSFIMS